MGESTLNTPSSMLAMTSSTAVVSRSSSNRGLAWLTEVSASVSSVSRTAVFSIPSAAPEPSTKRGLSKLPVESLSGDLEIDDESMSGVGWSGRVGLVSENVGPSFATDATFEWNGTGDWCTDGGPPFCVSIPGKSLIGSSP